MTSRRRPIPQVPRILRTMMRGLDDQLSEFLHEFPDLAPRPRSTATRRRLRAAKRAANGEEVASGE